MGMLDGVRSMVGGGSPVEPIPAPSYPELQGMYSNLESEDMTGVVGVALDNSSLVIQIRSFLSGQELVTVKDPQTGKQVTKWEQVSEPKMNEKGVRAVILELRARLDKNTIMTYIPNEDELYKFMYHFSMNMAIFIGRNAEEFDIKDNHISSICDFIVDMVLVTLWRGLHGNEKQGVYKQVRRIENVPLNAPQLRQNTGGGIFR